MLHLGYWRLLFKILPIGIQWNITSTGFQGGFPQFPGVPGSLEMNLKGMSECQNLRCRGELRVASLESVGLPRTRCITRHIPD
ncbi:unnamed protein product [Ranitomeya imitator]|uniref:Uncharacterized protein n=1 Tax=Ranitomeya imitator TaxID=111125 RepID=A0ABN9LE46_9NEOB|nr:unnamed protein product [Ranitomeya imitator]